MIATARPRFSPAAASFAFVFAVLASGSSSAAPDGATAVAGAASAGDPYAPELGNTGYDVTRYTLRLALDPAVQRVLDARATIDATSALAGLSRISLDFAGFDVKGVTVDGKRAEFRRDGRKLRIDLPSPLEAGAAFQTQVTYGGAPTNEASPFVPFVPHLGILFTEGTEFVVAEPDGARYWFPCNDHPRDKATFHFDLVVPAGLTGVANGHLVSGPTPLPSAFPDGRAGVVWSWEHDRPMATYLATVAVGSFVRVAGTSPKGAHLRSYVPETMRKQFEKLMPAIGGAIDWMSDHFGPYPFEEFGYVVVPGFPSSLETQTMVVLGDVNESTAVHEMAHQWFGDWVSLDSWQDVWRNEGFAKYVESLWQSRRDVSKLDARLAPSIRAPQPSRRPIGDPQRGELFGTDVYAKGSLFAHAIRVKLGDAAFFEGLRRYFEKYGGRTATRDQFRQELEAAGKTSLEDLFNAWLK